MTSAERFWGSVRWLRDKGFKVTVKRSGFNGWATVGRRICIDLGRDYDLDIGTAMLMHEYGHHLCGHVNCGVIFAGSKSILRREESAWYAGMADFPGGLWPDRDVVLGVMELGMDSYGRAIQWMAESRVL